MSKILFDEHPLVIPVETAKRLGLEEAIILQQVHYWLQDKAKSKDPKFFHDGRYWVYNTYNDWKATFPFWSISTIRRKIGGLEKAGLLLSANYNESATVRMKWYSIDYDKLEKAVQTEQMQPSSVSKCNCSNRTDGAVQNEQAKVPNPDSYNINILNRAKTTTKTTTHIPPIAPKGIAYSERFERFWKAYPSKVGKRVAWKAFQKLHIDDSMLSTMLKAIETQKRSDKWKRGIIPNPSTWLNQGRWEDELTENRPDSTSSNGNPWEGVRS